MHLHFSFGQGAVLFAVGCGNGAASPGAVSDGATALVIDAPAVLRDVLAQGGDAGPTDAPAPAKDASVFDPFDDPDAAAPIAGLGAITLTGDGQSGWVDGPRSLARLHNPTNVLLGPDGNVYVADYDNDDVRIVRPNGLTLTFTRQDAFAHPFGLAFAPDGTLYAQTDDDDTGHRSTDTGTLWRLDRRTGAATVFLRDIGRPRGLAVLADGRLAMVDDEHHVVRLLDPATRTITGLAGLRDMPGFADGTGAVARFDHPCDVVAAPGGGLLVADRGNNRIRRVGLDGVVTTWAGTGIAGSLDGPRANATVNAPQGLAVDAAGDVFITDTGAWRVRRVSAAGAVSTVAGDGTAGFADGQAMQARFFGLEGLDVSPDGTTLYVADGNRGGSEPNHRVRRVEFPTGAP